MMCPECIDALELYEQEKMKGILPEGKGKKARKPLGLDELMKEA